MVYAVFCTRIYLKEVSGMAKRARPPTQHKITCVEVVKDGRKQLVFMGTAIEGGETHGKKNRMDHRL